MSHFDIFMTFDPNRLANFVTDSSELVTDTGSKGWNMRYLLIDRVDALQRNRRVTATKCVALSEDHFLDHFPGLPVMPGALIIESMAQAATVLIEWSSDHTRKAILVMVKDLKFRSLVMPGDQIRIEEEIVSSHDGLIELQCSATVNDKIVASGSLIMASREASEIYHPAVLQVRNVMYDVWLRNTRIEE